MTWLMQGILLLPGIPSVFFLISKENFIQRHNNESHIVMYASEMSNFSGMLWAL